MNINRLLSILFTVVIMFLSASCSSDDEIGTIKPESNEDVVFSLRVPGINTSTRALNDDDEYEVETLDVLVFNNQTNEFLSRSSHKGVPKKGTGYTLSFYVGITPATGVTKYDFYILANARKAIELCLEDSNGQIKPSLTHKTDIQAALKETITAGEGWIINKSNSNYKLTPMWGEINNKELANGANYEGVLTRMTAKIDLNVALTGASYRDLFKLNEVKFYNYNTEGYLIPEIGAGKWNQTTGKADGPSITGLTPTLNVPIDYTSEIDKTVDTLGFAIYTFEAAAGTTANFEKNPCLLVNATWTPYGGTAKTGWYRLDLANVDAATHSTDYLALKRNHHYILTVTMINGPGYPSEDQALKSKPGNIITGIQEWEDNEMNDVVIDGAYFLSVTPGKFELPCDARKSDQTYSDNIISIKTNYTTTATGAKKGWYVEQDEIYDVTTNNKVTWLQLSSYSGNPKNANDPADQVKLILTENTGASSRSAYFYVRAGRLEYKVTVTQTTEPEVMLNIVNSVSNEPLGYMQFRSRTGVTPDPQSFKVLWSPAGNDLKIENQQLSSAKFPTGVGTGIPADGVAVSGGTGTMLFNATPSAIALDALDDYGDPVFEKMSELVFELTNGGVTKTQSIVMHQVCDKLVSDAEEYYALEMGYEREIFLDVKSNFQWKITSSNTRVLANSDELRNKTGGADVITPITEPLRVVLKPSSGDGSLHNEVVKITFVNANNPGSTVATIEFKIKDFIYVGRFGGELIKDASGVWQFTKDLYMEADIADKGYRWALRGEAQFYFKNLAGSFSNGKSNTFNLNKDPDKGTTSGFPAANYCFRFNDSWETIRKKDDSRYVWFLPSQSQLLGVWGVHNGIPAANSLITTVLSGYYWSSTSVEGAFVDGAYQGDRARRVRFDHELTGGVSGSATVVTVGGEHNVRCFMELSPETN